MVNKFLKLALFLVILFTLGCTSSDDEPQIQGLDQNNNSPMEFSKIMDYIKNNDNSDNGALNKGENNGNGVYFVPFISGAFTEWTLTWDVPNTNLVMLLEYPQDGNDRLLIFSGEEMMINWTSQEPRIFITDYADGKVKYSNWCDENKTGFYHINGKSTWSPVDIDGDGKTDIYAWNLSTLGKNFNMKVKTTLTDSQISDTWVWPVQGECREATEKVEFTYKGSLSNGRFTESATFK